MTTKLRMIGAWLIAVALLPGMAASQGNSQGKGQRGSDNQTAGDKVRAALPASEPVFAAHEITLIQGYFRTHRSSLPPGLAKRETLPPGLQKQLVQKGTLPPGLQKMIQPLPIELERQLVLLPTGYRRVVVAGNVILMNPTTGLIYDIVRNAIP
jgi:hypothetical protein